MKPTCSLMTPENEEVIWSRDERADYAAVFVLHSTRRGPAIGGTRLRRYESPEDAARDASALARAMTMKTALAGLIAGGGKAVILEPLVIRSRDRLLRAHGRAIEALGGRYISAPDLGISPEDLEIIASETRFVALHRATGGVDGQDTARGALRAIEGAAASLWGSRQLHGRRVAVQGCGSVGAYLARALTEAGATVMVTDLDEARAIRVAASIGATVIHPATFLAADVDVLAPCAVGGILGAHVVEQIRARIIAGPANNQLAHESVAELLADRDITLVPDCVASAGGVIAGYGDFESLTAPEIRSRIDAIFDRTLGILDEARRRGQSPTAVAHANARRLLD